jgi:hypothetical protein
MQKMQLKILNSKVDLSKFKFQDDKCNSIYISAPITTGTNFYEWYLKRGSLIEDSNEYKNAHYNEVIKPNLDKILKFHKDLSHKFNIPIIEPASFEMPGWDQHDYLSYWENVINHCVIKIIFLDGWCYSTGCTFEYYIGLKKGIELIDHNQIAIDPEWALVHIKQAIAEYSKVGINTDLQQKIVKEIQYEFRK